MLCQCQIELLINIELLISHLCVSIIFQCLFFQIFIEDYPEIEALPRNEVLHHLDIHAPQLIADYLVCIV